MLSTAATMLLPVYHPKLDKDFLLLLHPVTASSQVMELSHCNPVLLTDKSKATSSLLAVAWVLGLMHSSAACSLRLSGVKVQQKVQPLCQRVACRSHWASFSHRTMSRWKV